MRSAPVIELADCQSTSSLLKDMTRRGAEAGTVLWARRQSQGRGRSGRSFLSPEGGLYLSVLWRPATAPRQAACLSCAAALAVCRAVENCCGLSPQIKWPNDLLIKGKKVCGILAEGIDAGGFALVLGVGLNVNTAKFPPELVEKASSLALLSGRAYDIGALAEEVISQLDSIYAAWGAEGAAFLEEYRRRSLPMGRHILSHRGEKLEEAQPIAIEPDYSLRLRWQDGTVENKSFGEIFELD